MLPTQMLGRIEDAAKPLIRESRRCIISKTKLRKMNLITITLNDFITTFFVVTATTNLYHESLIKSPFKCIEIMLYFFFFFFQERGSAMIAH